MDIAAIAQVCAPNVAPGTLERIASVESSFNPWAIGVVGAKLERQPKSRDQALATVRMLAAEGYDFSIGLIQVNQKNFGLYGVTAETAFDPCTNLRIGALILEDCYKRAGGSARQMGDALSCYYSGNFSTGYAQGYVAKVAGAATVAVPQTPVQPIPVIDVRRRRTAARVAVVPKPVASAQLFVSTPGAPSKPASSGDVSPPAKANETALLF
jgi:type IV secretion system protein VirB1